MGRGTGHLLTLWSAAVRQALCPDIDEQITARLSDSEAWVQRAARALASAWLLQASTSIAAAMTANVKATRMPPTDAEPDGRGPGAYGPGALRRVTEHVVGDAAVSLALGPGRRRGEGS
jgi:hypothetical protein